MKSRLEELRERRLEDKRVHKMNLLRGIVQRLVLLGVSSKDLHDIMELVKEKSKNVEDMAWPRKR